MDLSKLSLIDGAEYLDEVIQLPRRAQELLFSLFSNDLLNDTNDGLEIIKTVLNTNCESFDFGYCKSPIEQIFYLAYGIVTSNEGYLKNEFYYLYPQKEIKIDSRKYIADFCFDTSEHKHVKYDNDFKLVIECDGHEFHEKTKEQVEKRNQRDFELKMAGYDILHFSGSQIYQNPIECATTVFKYIISKVGEADIDMNE